MDILPMVQSPGDFQKLQNLPTIEVNFKTELKMDEAQYFTL